MKQLSHWQQPENTRYVWDREYYENARYEAGRKEFEQQKNAMQNETRDALQGLEEAVSVDTVMQEFESSKAKEGFRDAAGQKIKITNNRKRVLETGDGRERIVLKERRNGKNVLKIKESWLKSPKLKLVDHNRDGVIDSDELEQGKVADEYRVTSETKEKRENISNYLSAVEKKVADLKKKDISTMDVGALSTFRADVVGQENELLKKWAEENGDEHATSAQKEQLNDLKRALGSLKDQIQARENEIAVVEQKDKFEELRKKIDELGNPDNMDAAQLAHLKKQVNDVYEAIKNGPLTEEQANTLRARLDAILQKIEARETAIENEKNGRENLLLGAEKAVGALPDQAQIIEQLKAGTLNITTLKSNFEKVKSQLDGLETNYEGWTPEQTDRLTQARETYNDKYESVEHAEKVLGVADTFKEQVKTAADQRAEQLQKLQEDLEKAKKNELKLGEEPELDELGEGDLETLGQIQEEHKKWQIQSTVFQNHANNLANEGIEFHNKFAEFENSKAEFDWSSLGAAALVGGFGTVGFVFGGPLGAAAGGWLATKIAKWSGFGENEEYKTLKKEHEEVKAEFDVKAPGLADYQEQLEENAAALAASLDDDGAAAQKVVEMKQQKADQIAQMKSEGVPQAFIDAVAGKFDSAIEQGLETPLASVKKDIVEDGDLQVSLGKNAEVIDAVAQVQTAINSVEVEPASMMDKTLGAAGKIVSGWGESLYKNSDNGIIEFIGGAVDGAGELVSGVGQLVEHPENLVHLFSAEGISAVWDGLTAKEERDLGEGAAAGGKIAFNVLSIIFGGPKRAFTKAKNLVKVPGEALRGVTEYVGKKAGEGSKYFTGVNARMAKVSEFSKTARSTIEKTSKLKVPRDAATKVADVTKKIEKLEGKGWRPFKRLRLRSLKIRKAYLDKFGKTSAAPRLGKTMTKSLDDLMKKYGDDVTKVDKYLKGRKSTLETRLKARQQLLNDLKSGKPRNDVLLKDGKITISWKKMGDAELIGKLEKNVGKTLPKQIADVTKLEKELTAEQGTRITSKVTTKTAEELEAEATAAAEKAAAEAWQPKHVKQGAALIVGGQAGEQLNKVDEMKTAKERAAEAKAAADKKATETPKQPGRSLETNKFKTFRESAEVACETLFGTMEELVNHSQTQTPAEKVLEFKTIKEKSQKYLKENLSDDAVITVDGNKKSLEDLVALSEAPNHKKYSFDVTVTKVSGTLKVRKVTATEKL